MLQIAVISADRQIGTTTLANLVLEIDQIATTDVCSFDRHLHIHEIAKGVVDLEVELPGHYLSSIDSDGLQQQKATLIPMRSRTFWSSAQYHCFFRAQKTDIKPSS